MTLDAAGRIDELELALAKQSLELGKLWVAIGNVERFLRDPASRMSVAEIGLTIAALRTEFGRTT